MVGRDEVVADWRKSSRSTQGECVEVRVDARSVLVRHSGDQDGVRLTFTHDEWRAFLAGVRDGEFELPT